MNARSAAPTGFFVTLTSPQGTFARKVETESLLVGRADDCGLTIPHETLSRRHLTISLKNHVFWVEDHASSNGTFINGKRIPPHQQVRLLPEDKLTLGQAILSLSVSTEPALAAAPPEVRSVSPIPATAPTPAPAAAPIAPVARVAPVLPTPPVPRLVRTEAAEVAVRSRDEAQQLSERALQNAQKQAVEIVQAAEVQAEKRVEDIYRRAHETQAKIDEVYQKRTNEAYRSAEEIYQKAQAESQSLLETARQRSVDLRAQAETFVQDLRLKTEADCARLLAEAQRTARDLKEQRLLEGEEQIQRREAALIEATKVMMDARVAQFERDMQIEAQTQNEQMEAERNTRREQLRVELQAQIDQVHDLREEAVELRELRAREQALLSEAEFKAKTLRDEARLFKEEAENARKSLEDLHRELGELRLELTTQVQTRTETQAGIGRLTDERRQYERRVEDAREQSEQELGVLRAQLEESKAQLEAQEAVRFEELRHQTARQVEAFEKQMRAELETKRDLMTREIAFAIENLSAQRGPLTSTQLQDVVGGHIDEFLVRTDQDGLAMSKQVGLATVRRRQTLKSWIFGAILGGVVVFGGEHAYLELSGNESPMLSFVQNAAKQQAAELEARKFNPPQTPEYKSTYVDNVVYTDNFVAKYTADDFQQKLMKQLSPYMIKTWRVEEEKVIELLGITSALVKGLAEKRAAIHPDFVPQGLAKMKEAEAEATARMRTLLGSSVRVETFKEFEKKFFTSYRSTP